MKLFLHFISEPLKRTAGYSGVFAFFLAFSVSSLSHAQLSLVYGYYTVEVTAGDKPEEIYWAIIDEDGDTLVQAGAPYTGEPTIVLPNHGGTLYMEDTGGDGWNGAELTLYSTIADITVIYETLEAPGATLPPGEVQIASKSISFFTPGWQGECNDVYDPVYEMLELEYGIILTKDMNSPYYWQIIYDEPGCCHFGWDGFCQTFYEDALAENAGKDCWAAVEIEPAVVFNDSRVNFDIDLGAVSTGYDCAISDNGQKEYWFKFTANRTNSLISLRREGAGNFNGAIEVYDGCGGAQLFCQDDYSTANEVAVFSTEIGHEYFFKVYHNGATVLSNTAVSAAVAYVPSTSLSASDCGRMNLTDGDIIRSAWPPNQFLLEKWMFEFKELEAPYNTYEVISPNGSNPQFRWFWFPQREPGRTYEVRTKPLMYQGPTWADWGASCVIGTAPAAPGQPAGIAQHPGGSSASFSNEIGVQIWPNPAQNEVNISFQPAADDSHADISVFDVSGKEVDRITYNFDKGAYQNLMYTNEKLDAGIYIFHIRTATGTSTARLVVTE
jgi:hypothetical protein